MDYSVIIQDRAERDIGEAFAYLYDRAPEAAIRWYHRLRADIERLSDMPARYAAAPESEKLGIDLRQAIYGKRAGRYRIIFRILNNEREVHVLAVRHGARKALEPSDIEP